MHLNLQKSKINTNLSIHITGSKSETNRLLLLKALFPQLEIENSSNSDDSEVMSKVLFSNEKVNDIHHAGTAMRFLTAFFAVQEGKNVVLTGSSRMKERPIKILVDALQQIGADITYQENEGFPPILIKGKKITQNKVTLQANVSSQYISALLLIAPKLEKGLELILEGKITSVPYIKMTLALLNEIGVETSFEENIIKVNNSSEIKSQILTVESDWSSVSYWYSIIALSEIGTKIKLSSYKQNSLQGDSALTEIYEKFGVETIFNVDNSITLYKKVNTNVKHISQNLNNCPDIAQTIVVTCFALGIECDLYGLHTLKIKETDRLEALKAELVKLGANVEITNDSLHLKASGKIQENGSVKTYQDHRMAMAFAPLALRVPICIEDAEVVSKSYPDFWNDLKKVGFTIEKV